MKEQRGRSNLETVFGVRTVPSDTWIRPQLRAQLDGIAPEGLSPIFNAALGTAEEEGLLQGYRVLEGGVLIALDGVMLYWSCLRFQKRTMDTRYGRSCNS